MPSLENTAGETIRDGHVLAAFDLPVTGRRLCVYSSGNADVAAACRSAQQIDYLTAEPGVRSVRACTFPKGCAH